VDDFLKEIQKETYNRSQLYKEKSIGHTYYSMIQVKAVSCDVAMFSLQQVHDNNLIMNHSHGETLIQRFDDVIYNYINLIMDSLILEFFMQSEALFRTLYDALKNPTTQKHIYLHELLEVLFSHTKEQPNDKGALFNILWKIRNTIHGAGIHWVKDESLFYKSKEYKFEYKMAPQFNISSSYQEKFDLINDSFNFIDELLFSTEVQALGNLDHPLHNVDFKKK
jgi:hypothetical protein